MPATDGPATRAREILRRVPLIDGHNDLLWQVRETAGGDFARCDVAKRRPQLMTDIPRLRRGGVGGQFWSVYVPSDLPEREALLMTLEQLDAMHRMIRRYPETFGLAGRAASVRRVFSSGRIASMAGVEGGHSIASSLPALRMLYALGARYMTLTHNDNTPWADSATDEPAHGGLTEFGERVVREMNRLGMLVDLSHVSPDTMRQAIRVSGAPVIFSHSSARTLCDVPRNVPDDVLEEVGRTGGIVMVAFVPGFVAREGAELSAAAWAERHKQQRRHPGDRAAVRKAMTNWYESRPEPSTTIADVADHIDHVRMVAGPGCVGLGSDFDGTRSMPRGLEDVSRYPALLAELFRRGYTEREVAGVAGLNLLRVMRRAEAVARA